MIMSEFSMHSSHRREHQCVRLHNAKVLLPINQRADYAANPPRMVYETQLTWLHVEVLGTRHQTEVHSVW